MKRATPWTLPEVEGEVLSGAGGSPPAPYSGFGECESNKPFQADAAKPRG